MAKKEFRAKELKLKERGYLESHKGEPAGLYELRKQVIEAKGGPLELRKKKGKGAWDEKEGQGYGQKRKRERERLLGPSSRGCVSGGLEGRKISIE